MKKLTALLLAAALVCSLAACSSGGGEGGSGSSTPPASAAPSVAPTPTPTPEPTEVTATDTITIDAICVDDSYVEEEGSPLKMVYLFYTFTAADENLKIDSKYTTLTINETNEYESDHFADSAAACNYTDSYYYGSYIEDVYVGSSLKVAATFKIPEGDLAAGRSITLSDDQIPDADQILLSTDMIQHFSTPEELAQAVDPDGYAAEMANREPADAETTSLVKGQINGYQWTFYINSMSYSIEFWADNNFQVSTGLGTSNSGTYAVQKGYVVCTYPGMEDTPVRIPYTIENGEVDLDVIAGFDVMS